MEAPVKLALAPDKVREYGERDLRADENSTVETYTKVAYFLSSHTEESESCTSGVVDVGTVNANAMMDDDGGEGGGGMCLSCDRYTPVVEHQPRLPSLSK